MNVHAARCAAHMHLRNASYSPRKVTFVYLLLIYALLIPYNLFTILYTYHISAQSSGFDAIERLTAYHTFVTAAPLVISLLNQLWDSVYSVYMLRMSTEPNVGLSALLDALHLLGKLLWLTIQLWLRIFLSFCLFIIPGIIAFYRYRFSYFFLALHPEISTSQALMLSSNLTAGRKLSLFRLDLSFFYYFALISACNAFINLPYFFALPNAGMQTDTQFYLIGTLAAFTVQLLFLPHQRASLTAAFLQIIQEDACAATSQEV